MHCLYDWKCSFGKVVIQIITEEVLKTSSNQYYSERNGYLSRNISKNILMKLILRTMHLLVKPKDLKQFISWHALNSLWLVPKSSVLTQSINWITKLSQIFWKSKKPWPFFLSFSFLRDLCKSLNLIIYSI